MLSIECFLALTSLSCFGLERVPLMRSGVNGVNYFTTIDEQLKRNGTHAGFSAGG